MSATKLLILFSAIILTFSNCYGGDGNWATNQLGGVENATIIARPISVKAWRTVGSLELENGNSFPSDSFITNLYRKSGSAILVSTNLAAQLSKVLLDEHSYPPLSQISKSCFPEPGVVITFFDGKKNVDVFFCFECAILIIETDGKATAGGLQTDFDPSRTELVRIIKKIFPQDARIQSLQESE